MGHKGPVLRPRCFGTSRARTQVIISIIGNHQQTLGAADDGDSKHLDTRQCSWLLHGTVGHRHRIVLPKCSAVYIYVLIPLITVFYLIPLSFWHNHLTHYKIKVKITVLRDMKPCSLVERYRQQHFEGAPRPLSSAVHALTLRNTYTAVVTSYVTHWSSVRKK
jgi:hypothetical protein